MNVSVSRFRVVIFRCGVSPERKARGRDHHQGLGLHHCDPLLRLGVPGLDRDLLEPLDRRDRVALLGLLDRGDLELRMARRAHCRETCSSSGFQAAIAWSGFFSVA